MFLIFPRGSNTDYIIVTFPYKGWGWRGGNMGHLIFNQNTVFSVYQYNEAIAPHGKTTTGGQTSELYNYQPTLFLYNSSKRKAKRGRVCESVEYLPL